MFKKIYYLFSSKKSGRHLGYKHYKSIDFCPCWNYGMVLETGDIRYILKLEDYEDLPLDINAEELAKAWQSINNEFGQAHNDNSHVIYTVKYQSFVNLQWELFKLEMLRDLNKVAPNSKETKEAFKYCKVSPSSVHKKIAQVEVKLQLKKKELEEEQEETGQKVDFFTIIDDISNIKGYPINPHTTTLRQFLTIKNNIKKQHGDKR